MTEVSERTGAKIVRFEDSAVKVQHPEGRFYKSFDIAEAVVDADAIVSIPKLKTHGLTYISCAIKNIFGCIPGRRKAIFHAQAGEDCATFSQMLVDLLGTVKPRLSIVDAIVAMEGDGPVDGKPRQVGLIIVGSDPVAVDSVAASVFGIEPNSIDMIRIASEQGLGVSDLSEIEILGEKLDYVVCRDFVKPKSGNFWHRIPKVLRNPLKNQLIPFPYITSKCKKCGACVKACPVATIENQSKRPKIKLDGCIRCHCCREVCEFSAIDLKEGKLSSGIGFVINLRRDIYRLLGKR